MTFNSLEFGLFFAICLGLYLLLPLRAQNRLLLVASYVFYGAWNTSYLALIAISSVVGWSTALGMQGQASRARRKGLLIASLAINLGILGYFKYANFFAESLVALFASFGITLHWIALGVLLPVGISFYTFQTIGYSIDVFRGRVAPERNLLDFALYVSFFPQLVAGPIERADRLLPQIRAPRSITWERVGSGSWLVLWGLFQKVVIADNLAFLVDMVFGAGAEPTGAEVLLAVYAFAIQIYCDFSGYTDIARGVARIMGFELMLNFNLPYAAANPSDFWRRWHISLSTWLRDYLYISLGGNRGGAWRTMRNLMLTMALGGLWHGATGPCVIWGIYHGALLIAHRLAAPGLARIAPTGRAGAGVWHIACVATMFHLSCLGWLIFRSDSTAQLLRMLSRLAGDFGPGLALEWLVPVATLVSPLLLMWTAQAIGRDHEVVLRWPLPLRAAVYVFLLFGLNFFGVPHGKPFIYFQF